MWYWFYSNNDILSWSLPCVILQYYQCEHGEPTQRYCAEGLYFNPATGQCDYPASIDTSTCNEAWGSATSVILRYQFANYAWCTRTDTRGELFHWLYNKKTLDLFLVWIMQSQTVECFIFMLLNNIQQATWRNDFVTE